MVRLNFTVTFLMSLYSGRIMDYDDANDDIELIRRMKIRKLIQYRLVVVEVVGNSEGGGVFGGSKVGIDRVTGKCVFSDYAFVPYVICKLTHVHAAIYTPRAIGSDTDEVEAACWDILSAFLVMINLFLTTTLYFDPTFRTEKLFLGNPNTLRQRSNV